MAVTFTQSKNLLATLATDLASQATDAGLTSLSTSLTNLSTEISSSNSSITEREFFGGGTTSYSFAPEGGSGSGTDYDSAALVWSSMLTTASKVIENKHVKDIKDDVEEIRADIDTIKDQQITIAAKHTLIEGYMLKLKDLGEGSGIHTIQPYTMFQLVPLYQSLIERSQIFTDGRDPFTDPARQAQAVQTYKDYVEKMTSMLVNPWNIGTFDSPGDYPDAT